MALGQILRQRREEMGFTLDELGHKTGYSKPYLSTIETGRTKNPPSDDLLSRLERLLKFTPGMLLHIAHMERLPADLRQEFERGAAEHEQIKSLVNDMIRQGGSIDNLVKKPAIKKMLGEDRSNVEEITAGRLVPIINQVMAGYPADFDDKGYPVGGADDYVRCPDLHDPNAFAVRVVGDSMEPKYRQGDILIFSPRAKVQNGDDCFVRMEAPHETTLKQVFFEEEGIIRLQPRNNKYAPMMLPRERINGLWKAVIRYEML